MKYTAVVDWHWGKTGNPDAVILEVDEENDYKICDAYSLTDQEWRDPGDVDLWLEEEVRLFDSFEEALEATEAEMEEEDEEVWMVCELGHPDGQGKFCIGRCKDPCPHCLVHGSNLTEEEAFSLLEELEKEVEK
ncbi:MAG TPA: hypothetical protein ENG09_00155 [Candidatus Syntrophoarchaeum butanivorans]|uniref:Uncharacterized protein n=1 Tax=Candidatus Syntropharchaeum butanivorans TaxID=1839936 RepID=A0A7C0X204_9EURY|nr:hypothetical protein [Candidatus Syntrophoarchaeum butanivorans]